MFVYIIDSYFQSATSGIYKDIWDHFDPEDGHVSTWDEGVDKVGVLAAVKLAFLF